MRKLKLNIITIKFRDSRGNTAKAWKTIREIVPNCKNIAKDCNFEDEATKPNEYNVHFANVGRSTFEKTQETLHNGRVSYSNVPYFDDASMILDGTPFKPQPVDTDTIILTIKDLTDKNSVDSDGIHLKFIKDSLYFVAFYLTCIINTSNITRIFPSSWKHTLVVPVFKSGDSNDMNNYRLISLIPIVSKMLEKVVAGQLKQFLEFNNLFSSTQHGFRPRLSIEAALTFITDKIFGNIDTKKIFILTLCDLSKAFDSVSHDILIRKCVKVNKDSFWFSSYTKNRTQSVRINKIISGEVKVDYGVPQGSILGPSLFSIYAIDLAEKINKCTLIQYADDTQFLQADTVDHISNLISNTEHSLRDIKRYLLTNGLLLNPKKTQCIFNGNRQLLARIPLTHT